MTQLRRAARAKPKHKHKHKHKHGRHARQSIGDNANARYAFDYFKSKGLTDTEASAIVGNLWHESGHTMDPTQRQILRHGRVGRGRGIVQWETGGRWDHDHGDNVVEFAKKHGESPTSLNTQLDFVWYELNEVHRFGHVLPDLKSAKNLAQATAYFESGPDPSHRKTGYENPGKAHTAERIAAAKAALAAFGGGGSRQITHGEDSVVLGKNQHPAAHVDSPDSGGGKIKEGHPTVFVGKKQLPFARVGDPTKIKDGEVVDGDATVLLGDHPGSSHPGHAQTSKSLLDMLLGR